MFYRSFVVSSGVIVVQSQTIKINEAVISLESVPAFPYMEVWFLILNYLCGLDCRRQGERNAENQKITLYKKSLFFLAFKGAREEEIQHLLEK